MAIITYAPPQCPRYDFPIKKRPRRITLFIRPPQDRCATRQNLPGQTGIMRSAFLRRFEPATCGLEIV